MHGPAKSTPSLTVKETDSAERALSPGSLTRDHLYEQIAAHLQTMIVECGMRPGDRLPTERALCDMFGVSRTVLREALKTLAARGLVSIEVGRGTFINDGTAQAALDSLTRHFQADHTSLSELHEARLTIEPTIAALAAQRITPEGAQRLADIVERLAISVDDEDAWLQADQEFHQTLAEISENRVLLMFITSIVDLLQHARRVCLARWREMDEAVAMHRDIFIAVRAADPVAASDAMQRHLARVGVMFAAAQEEQLTSIAP